MGAPCASLRHWAQGASKASRNCRKPFGQRYGTKDENGKATERAKRKQGMAQALGVVGPIRACEAKSHSEMSLPFYSVSVAPSATVARPVFRDYGVVVRAPRRFTSQSVSAPSTVGLIALLFSLS